MRTRSPFHVTLPMPEQMELDFTQKARHVNKKVLQVFTDFPDRELTSRQVHDILIERGIQMELTSVRRAVNYLWFDGHGEIELTGQIKERKNVNNNTYRIKG